MLYQITSEITSLNDQISDVLAADDLTDEQKDAKTLELFNQYLLADSSFDKKADGLGGYIKQLEAEAEAIKAEAKRIAIIGEQKANLAKRLRTKLLEAMQAVGKDKITGTYSKLSLRKNPPKLVLDVEVDELPDDCIITKTVKTPDKDQIKLYLEKGVFVEGMAHLEHNQSLVIK